MVFLLDILIC